MADEEKAPESGAPAETLQAAPTPEPDHKALLEQAQAELGQKVAEVAKLHDQLSTMRGIAGQRLDLEARDKRLQRELKGLRETIDILVEENEDLKPKAVEIRNRYAQEDAQEGQSRILVELWQDIGEEVAEAFDKDMTTPEGGREVTQLLQTRPELSGLWNLANQGWQSQNPGLLRQALKEARDLRRDAQTKGWEEKMKQAKAQAEAEARKEADERVKEKLEESGVLVMPGAKAAGGTAQRKVSHGEYLKMSPEEQRKNYPAFLAWYKDQIGG